MDTTEKVSQVKRRLSYGAFTVRVAVGALALFSISWHYKGGLITGAFFLLVLFTWHAMIHAHVKDYVACEVISMFPVDWLFAWFAARGISDSIGSNNYQYDILFAVLVTITMVKTHFIQQRRILDLLEKRAE